MKTERFSEANEARVKLWHGEDWKKADWTGADWSNAMQGEAGEAGNVVKKLRRIETGVQQAEQGTDKAHNYYNMLVDKLADEIADTYTYLDLLAQYYTIDIGEAVRRKFNAISEREGFPQRVDDDGNLWFVE